MAFSAVFVSSISFDFPVTFRAFHFIIKRSRIGIKILQFRICERRKREHIAVGAKPDNKGRIKGTFVILGKTTEMKF